MITITLKEQEYSVPSNWLDVSIGKYQEMCKLEDENLDDIDKTICILSIISGIDKDVLYSLPYTEYKKIVELLSFISSDLDNKLEYSVEINGDEYVFNHDIMKYTTRQVIDIEELSKDNLTDNLHILMAVVYNKNGEEYDIKNVMERAELFKNNMNISCAISAQVFFSTLNQHYINYMEDYLKKKQ